VIIARDRECQALSRLLQRHPLVGIIGTRQVGKTTLARMLAAQRKGPKQFFDLENPADLARLSDPLLALQGLRGLIVIDEVQRLPGLFPVLRVLADRPRRPARFLVLGSASPELLRQGSETLAGRIVYHTLRGFGLDEVGIGHLPRLWLRGGLPRSYLARSHAASDEWRQAFIGTFLERDLPQLGITINAVALRRFWTMLAHYHAQTWNSSEFARSFGVSDTTVRHYLDVLTAALVVRQLLPWHENLSKRQVRSPKVYVQDTGLLHALLDLHTPAELESHPKVGASWEGFMLEQVVRQLRARPEECYFWATHAGAELDLLIVRGAQRIGFEFKRTTAPHLSPSMRAALADLRLKSLEVVHAGEHTFPLATKVRAVAASRLLQDLHPLR
jgi:predicted AAA+ superfamily ATPase